MIRFGKAIKIIGFLISITASNFVHADLRYNITDLGSAYWNSIAINNLGQVAGGGAPNASQSIFHAFVRDTNGQIFDFGTLGGPNSIAFGINDAGQVTGWSDKIIDHPNPYIAQHAFIVDANHIMTDLGGNMSFGNAINTSGQVAGTANGGAFITSPTGEMIGLGGLPGLKYSEGYGINDLGQVVGDSWFGSSDISNVFVTDSNGNRSTIGWGHGSDINNLGQITGYSNFVYSSFTHAFITDSDNQMIDLGTLGGNRSEGYSINDSGQVVGQSYTASGSTHAFITDNGVMKDLNDALIENSTGWNFITAKAINNLGQITGYGSFNGLSHGYILTPVSAVPVPAAFWLFTSGLGLLTLKGLRKNKKC